MKHTAFTLPLLLLALGFSTACSTPSSRIKKNPALFEKLNKDMQLQVQEGAIALGFPKDAVYLALGKADRTYTRTTSNNVAEVWSYVGLDIRYERQRVSGHFRYRDHKGRSRTAYDTIWVRVEHEHEYERFRVEFNKDHVVAIEETKR